MKITPVTGATLLLLVTTASLSAATVVLDLSDANPENVDVLYLAEPYTSQGFVLASNGTSPGFNTYGTGAAGFFAGVPGFSPLLGGTVDLRATDDSTFSLISIDLARNFAFDPAPTVTFTGNLAGGGTIMQTFTVTTPIGTPAFETFVFTGFTDLASVNWGQASVAEAGLHQFTNVVVDTEEDTAVIPEPSSILLLGTGALVYAVLRRRA